MRNNAPLHLHLDSVEAQLVWVPAAELEGGSKVLVEAHVCRYNTGVKITPPPEAEYYNEGLRLPFLQAKGRLNRPDPEYFEYLRLKAKFEAAP